MSAGAASSRSSLGEALSPATRRAALAGFMGLLLE